MLRQLWQSEYTPYMLIFVDKIIALFMIVNIFTLKRSAMKYWEVKGHGYSNLLSNGSERKSVGGNGHCKPQSRR
jgi:hypothetical protein